MKILGVHHVALQVTDLDEARRFYGEVLDFPEITRPDFGVDGLWYQAGAQQLHLVVEDGHIAPESQHFALHVDDLDAAIGAIEAHDVRVARIGAMFPGAGAQAFLRDPSGNLIELNQPD